MAQGIGDFLNQVFASSTTFTYGDIILSLAITFAMAMFIYLIYKKTYSGVLYSKNFNVTLVIVSLVVCVIMIGISRNLALSLGLVGALSIVRFRNAIKDSKDVAFLFWSISVGIINGVQFYKLSIIATVVISLVLILLSKKIVINQPYLLILKFDDLLSDLEEKALFKLVKEYSSKSQVRNRVITDSESELTVEVKLKDQNHAPLLKSLKKQLKGLTKAMLISYTGDLHE